MFMYACHHLKKKLKKDFLKDRFFFQKGISKPISFIKFENIKFI